MFIQRLITEKKLKKMIQDEEPFIVAKYDSKGRMIDVSTDRWREHWTDWKRYQPASFEERHKSAMKILGLDK